MTNELEPLKECPFCCGEDGKHSEDFYIIMSQENVSFINLHHKPMYTSKELREAYNTRYKRTCKMQRIKRDKYADEYECQTCYGHTWTPFGAKPEYCCHCGAEVVDG